MSSLPDPDNEMDVIKSHQPELNLGRPSIPTGVHSDDIVAIVTVHHPKASHVNRDTPFTKSLLTTPQSGGESSLDGCHIFLQSLGESPAYSMGRASSTMARDVYFPGTKTGPYQFYLAPILESDCWRLQSFSEALATVNGVPIRNPTKRTKKSHDQIPHAVHLSQDSVNYAVIKDLRIDIWLLKTAREALFNHEFPPEVPLPQLQKELQDVTLRPEPWAREQYIFRTGQVSANSRRVLQRFTAVTQNAKLFRDDIHGRKRRDEEFRMFAKAKVDASIVRYLRLVEIEQIPAVITEMHDGFQSYAALEDEIKTLHPGIRFSIASKLLRRLFSALAFLHFKGIIHGNVTKEGVLLRLVNSRPDAVLLVDYSAATTFSEGMAPPLEKMAEEGKIAMEMVEGCCDIWQLRKAASKDALSQEFCAKLTEDARKEFQLVERVVADFFDAKGKSRQSSKGKKLLRLLDMKQNAWHSAQANQVHNSSRREIGMCRMPTIQDMEEDWAKTHPVARIGEDRQMILSLGHSYLDSLATRMYHGRWDATPMDVCAKITELAGEIEEPWQTIPVTRTVTFTRSKLGFEYSCILEWLASCCEVFPEWRTAIENECERHIHTFTAMIAQDVIGRLCDALSSHGTLPPPMVATFARLTSDEIDFAMNIRETHLVLYHKPSRMFNVTQIHRLAGLKRLVTCITEGHIPCDHYIEVRGEPRLEGLYVPLSLLITFAMSLGLSLAVPDHTQEFPAYDPADFSKAVHFVILAHTSLVPWASVTREGGQFNFHAPLMPLAFESRGTFLATYFGSMKVLPKSVPGSREVYERPDHWSKFKTASEIEDATDSSKRKILPTKGSFKKANPGTISRDVVFNDHPLRRVLKYRDHERATVQLPKKRNADGQETISGSLDAKRSRNTSAVESPAKTPIISMSFMDRVVQNLERQAEGVSQSFYKTPTIAIDSFYKNGENQNLSVAPPNDVAALKQSFTIASRGSFDLNDDIKQADKWLEMISDGDEEPVVAGLFGFDFHHSFRQQGDGSDTEAASDDDDKWLPPDQRTPDSGNQQGDGSDTEAASDDVEKWLPGNKDKTPADNGPANETEPEDSKEWLPENKAGFPSDSRNKLSPTTRRTLEISEWMEKTFVATDSQPSTSGSQSSQVVGTDTKKAKPQSLSDRLTTFSLLSGKGDPIITPDPDSFIAPTDGSGSPLREEPVMSPTVSMASTYNPKSPVYEEPETTVLQSRESSTSPIRRLFPIGPFPDSMLNQPAGGVDDDMPDTDSGGFSHGDMPDTKDKSVDDDMPDTDSGGFDHGDMPNTEGESEVWG